MPLNIPGLLAPFQLLFRPRLLVPSLTIKDLRYLDFYALYKAGYRGAVIDKDNCLTLPYEDTLVPELKETWEECKKVFGSENILIVSNSAGTRLDPGGIEAEAVSYHLGVPVLRHDTMKPGYACMNAIRAYFASLPRPIPDTALFIVGDRILTDVILANRMRPYRELARKEIQFISLEKGEIIDAEKEVQSKNESEGPKGPLSILVEDVWKKDAVAMRYLEKKLAHLVQQWNKVPDDEVRRVLVRS